jgi:hypothetical protein
MKYLSLILLLAIPVLATPTKTIKQRQIATSEFVGVGCSLPLSYSFTADKLLPDPFTFANGTKVTKKSDWPCRRQEINDLFQKYELGTKPLKPSSVTGTFIGGKITVVVSNGGKSITFSASIKAPSGGTAPYPAIIGIGGLSIPVPAGVGTITFDNDGMAAPRASSLTSRQLHEHRSNDRLGMGSIPTHRCSGKHNWPQH